MGTSSIRLRLGVGVGSVCHDMHPVAIAAVKTEEVLLSHPWVGCGLRIRQIGQHLTYKSVLAPGSRHMQYQSPYANLQRISMREWCAN